jgi:hypothetical protein
MIACPHAHPYGESYCTYCQQDKARSEEKQRLLDMIEFRLKAAQSRDVRMVLLSLKGELT